jgi:hypothetical protein
MEKITKNVLYILLVLVSLPCFSQQKLLSGLRSEASSGLLVSTNNRTPFLLKANQYGTMPLESQLLYLNAKFKKEYDSLFTIDRKLKKFNVGYELEPHINLGKTSQILLVQAYVKARYGAFEFYAGRRREIQGLVDTSSTMGSYIWSGNALPVPKVEISIPNYTPISKNGLIAIKGNFAHGWFGRGDSVQNVLLHQKSLYAKLGKPTWKIHLFGGFNHQVQWGGYPTVPYYDKISNQMITRYNRDFSSFLNVATGVSLNKNGDGLSQGAPANEALNRVGNHLGTVDIGMEIQTTLGRLILYRQSIYEDGSLYYLSNISDGLFGVSLKTRKGIFQNICLEYLDTRSQGGNGSSGNTISELRGSDNYFRNGIYTDNWTYKRKVIGNSLLSLKNETKERNNEKLNENYIMNNRLSGINFTIHYTLAHFYGITKIIKTQNLGNYNFPFDKNQFSASQTFYVNFKGVTYSANLAIDQGALRPNNIGIHLAAKKSWNY